MAASVARARRAIGLSIISPSAMDQTRKQAKLEFAGVPPKPRRWARTPHRQRSGPSPASKKLLVKGVIEF
jgi:hypothetical protein